MATKTPEETQVEVQKTAGEMIIEFCAQNRIDLYTDDVSGNLLTVSDGSLVVKKPQIRARNIK